MSHQPVTPTRVRVADERSQEIVVLARDWLPFGGPGPYDIMVEFGMNERKFYSTLRSILDHYGCQRLGINREHENALREQCGSKLHALNESLWHAPDIRFRR